MRCQAVRENGDLGRRFIGSDTEEAFSGGTDSMGVNPFLSGV